MSELIEAVRRALERNPDADRALEETVVTLAAEPEISWAGIAFVEDGELTLGPTAGCPDEGRRRRVPIVYDDAAVGELQVDGDPEHALLVQVAELVSPYVLIGWDTSGEPWEP